MRGPAIVQPFARVGERARPGRGPDPSAMTASNELLTRLQTDMKAAMKARETARLATIRLMIAELKSAQLAGTSDDMTLEQEQDVLRKMVKNRRDTIEQAQQGGRDDIVANETAEIAVIQEYLPQMLTGDALLAKVREVAGEVGYSGPADKGKFMKAWMAKYKGIAEGRDVQDALGSIG
jgi:uncharacterized protein YqeY